MSVASSWNGKLQLLDFNHFCSCVARKCVARSRVGNRSACYAWQHLILIYVRQKGVRSPSVLLAQIAQFHTLPSYSGPTLFHTFSACTHRGLADPSFPTATDSRTIDANHSISLSS
eukprot:435586-Amphidinium_carterae.1